MTYKKADFYNSPTMRQFAKIASDKGWLKSEIKKEASNNEPKSFIENTLSLTSELKNQNDELLNKLAEEIEFNLIQYKTANSNLYNVFKETGEDLVDQAHPKGSHKLEGVLGDAIVETVVDQQHKIHEVVFKKPKGKLANQKLIELVKQASLLWNTESEDKIKKEILSLYNKNLQGQLEKIKKEVAEYFEKPDTLDEIRISNRHGEKTFDIVRRFIKNVREEIIDVTDSLTDNIYDHLNNLKANLLKCTSLLDYPLVNELILSWKKQMIALIIHFNKLIDQYLVSLGSVGEAKHKAYKELHLIEHPDNINATIQNKIKEMNNKLGAIISLVKTLQVYEAGSGKYAKEIVWLEKPFRNDLNKSIAEFSKAGENIITGNKAEIFGNIITNSKQVEDVYNAHFKNSYALFDKFTQISS